MHVSLGIVNASNNVVDVSAVKDGVYRAVISVEVITSEPLACRTLYVRKWHVV